MICSIIYYISYKTGYIQRVFEKKFRNNDSIKLISALAAVSAEDLCVKFKEAFEKSDTVFLIGGMSTAHERNIITVLSDFFSENGMEVVFNKKIINPDGGYDGNLIKSGNKYVAVLPDEPAHIEKMIGNEFMKNIDIAEQVTVTAADQTSTPSVTFAPEPDYSFEGLRKKKASDIFLKVCIAVGAVTVIAAVVWIIWQMTV